jgi:hypothetical protein
MIAEARPICEAVGWPRGIAWCNREEGLATLDLGDPVRARDLLRAAVDGFTALGEPGLIATTQAELAGAYLALHDHETARSLAEQAATSARGGLHGVEQPQAILFTLYRILLACNDGSSAREALAAAHASVETQGGHMHEPDLRASFVQAVPINRAIIDAIHTAGSTV